MSWNTSLINLPISNDVIKLPIGFALIMNPRVVEETPFAKAKGGKKGVIKEPPILVSMLHIYRRLKIVFLFINTLKYL